MCTPVVFFPDSMLYPDSTCCRSTLELKCPGRASSPPKMCLHVPDQQRVQPGKQTRRVSMANDARHSCNFGCGCASCCAHSFVHISQHSMLHGNCQMPSLSEFILFTMEKASISSGKSSISDGSHAFAVTQRNQAVTNPCTVVPQGICHCIILNAIGCSCSASAPCSYGANQTCLPAVTAQMPTYCGTVLLKRCDSHRITHTTKDRLLLQDKSCPACFYRS